jgi:ABC-2 type transport system ATP-binding protein
LAGGNPTKLMTDLASYILEINAPNPEQIMSQLTPLFGTPIQEDQALSFKIVSEDVDFSQLQRSLGDAVSSMQWRRPNLNDVYLWVVCNPNQGEA